jgi:hypothetical protein
MNNNSTMCVHLPILSGNELCTVVHAPRLILSAHHQ